MDALVNPFPSELTTPPVTNTYFVMELHCNGKYSIVQQVRSQVFTPNVADIASGIGK